jgi:hypothetical protein
MTFSYACAKSKKLIAIINDLRDFIFRYRILILRYEGMAAIAIQDHKEMIALMKVKNARQVEKLVRKHIIREWPYQEKDTPGSPEKKKVKRVTTKMELVKKVLHGDEGSAARLISMIERGLMRVMKQFLSFSSYRQGTCHRSNWFPRVR